MFIVTWDAEVFGSGEGDFEQVVAAPTLDFVNLVNTYGIVPTIFLEVSHARILVETGEGAERNVRRFMDDLRRLDVDLQVHVHTQWREMDGRGLPRGGWWIEEEDEEGRCWFDELVEWAREFLGGKSGGGDVFRAGGLNLRPWMLEYLVEKKFVCDSSIYRGAYSDTQFLSFDGRFLQTNDPFVWVLPGAGTEGPKRELLEVPISSFPMRGIEVLLQRQWMRRLRKGGGRRMMLKQGVGQWGVGGLLRRLARRSYRWWDICLVNRSVQSRWAKRAAGQEVTVVIGHSKDYPGRREMAGVLDAIGRHGLVDDAVSLRNAATRLKETGGLRMVEVGEWVGGDRGRRG